MELTKSIYTLIKWRIIRCMYVSNYRIRIQTSTDLKQIWNKNSEQLKKFNLLIND